LSHLALGLPQQQDGQLF
jgi:hypothetical protein